MKLFIGSLVVFFLVILFLFALFPSEIVVTRVVQINRRPAEVLKQIDDLREWEIWNEFIIRSKEAGATSREQNQVMDSASIDMSSVHIQLVKVNRDTVFTVWSRGNDSFAGNFILAETNGQTLLAWDLKFHVKWYPWAKLASMFYDKNLGPQMEKSLMKLKNEMETKAP